MRILVASDLQIGAGVTLGRTLSDYDELLARIVEVAREQEADLFLGLGDAFQNRTTNRDQDEVFMRFLVAMSRECQVLWVNGNHDWRGYERASTVGLFREMGVTISAEPGVYRYGSVAVATLPWTALGHMVAGANGNGRGALAEDAGSHLVTIAGGLRREIAEAGDTAILAAHWAVSGARLPTGLPTDALSEPVVEISELEAQGWDVMAFGHVHYGQSVGERGGAFVCGSPYACDWGETGFPHGVWIVEPDAATRSAGEEAVLTPRFIPVSDRFFSRLDLSHLEEPPYEIPEAAVLDAIVHVDEIVVPAEQARRIDVRALRKTIYDAGAHFVSPIVVRPERDERVRVEALTNEISELEAVALWCEANGIAPPRQRALRERTERLLQAVAA